MKYFLLVFILLSSNCYSQELPMGIFDRTINKQLTYSVPIKVKVDVKPPKPILNPPSINKIKPILPDKAISKKYDPKTIPISPKPNKLYPSYPTTRTPQINNTIYYGIPIRQP